MTTPSTPTQFCTRCGIGPFFHVPARRFPTLCLGCADDPYSYFGGYLYDAEAADGTVVYDGSWEAQQPSVRRVYVVPR